MAERRGTVRVRPRPTEGPGQDSAATRHASATVRPTGRAAAATCREGRTSGGMSWRPDEGAHLRPHVVAT
ncbi:hypothetical protein ACH4HG_21150 [Streptomyces coeruleorubidus]